MANNFMHYTCYLVVLTICIDQGDGRWKRRDKKENLRHDIEIFRKMTDKVEQDIEDFYDEFPDEKLRGDNVDILYYKYVQNTMGRNSLVNNGSDVNGLKLYPSSVLNNLSSNNIPTNVTENLITNGLVTNKHVSFRDDQRVSSNQQKSEYIWPKFEDILKEMGKRYDWKNDRWIKVRRKNKGIHPKNVKVKNDVNFHDKHKFSYRIVKLNRNKNRRNVVVAVSAVR